MSVAFVQRKKIESQAADATAVSDPFGCTTSYLSIQIFIVWISSDGNSIVGHL